MKKVFKANFGKYSAEMVVEDGESQDITVEWSPHPPDPLPFGYATWLNSIVREMAESTGKKFVIVDDLLGMVMHDPTNASMVDPSAQPRTFTRIFGKRRLTITINPADPLTMDQRWTKPPKRGKVPTGYIEFMSEVYQHSANLSGKSMMVRFSPTKLMEFRPVVA